MFLKDFVIGLRAIMDEGTTFNLRDNEEVAHNGFQPEGRAAPKGNAFLDDQLFELNGDTEVFTVVTAELVLDGILEPSARRFVVNEKSEYDGICAASGS